MAYFEINFAILLSFSYTLEERYTCVRFVLQTLRDKHFFAKASSCDFSKGIETFNYQPNKLNLGPTIWDMVLLISNENLFVIICN